MSRNTALLLHRSHREVSKANAEPTIQASGAQAGEQMIEGDFSNNLQHLD